MGQIVRFVKRSVCNALVSVALEVIAHLLHCSSIENNLYKLN